MLRTFPLITEALPEASDRRLGANPDVIGVPQDASLQITENQCVAIH
jgi:hypothetical protein